MHFDQALWWKALQVLQSPRCDLDAIIIRMGGFHTQMSFLGCIGYIMSSPGLVEALETVYAGNTIQHMLSGKAVKGAMRGHQLVDLALNTILLQNVCDSSD